MRAITEIISICLGCVLLFIGIAKVTPNFNPELHELLKVHFGQINRVFPLFHYTHFRPYARTYRCVFGLSEIITGTILIAGKAWARKISTFLQFIAHSVSLYSMYLLHEQDVNKFYIEGAILLALFILFNVQSFRGRCTCTRQCRKYNVVYPTKEMSTGEEESDGNKEENGHQPRSKHHRKRYVESASDESNRSLSPIRCRQPLNRKW